MAFNDYIFRRRKGPKPAPEQPSDPEPEMYRPLQLLDHETAMHDAADDFPVIKLYSGWPQCIPSSPRHVTHYDDLNFYAA